MFPFLLNTIVISLSGVMAPGSITAATLAQGCKNRWAGAWVAVGHGIVEIPLIFLLILGLGLFLEKQAAQITIGLLGGLFLVYLGIMTVRELFHPDFNSQKARSSEPVMTGMVLSATNPYFLFWWVAVGLNLALQAKGFGFYAIIIFAFVHWSCDLIWLTILSMAAFHGTNILRPKVQKWIFGFCGIAMAAFGLKFLYDAVKLLF